MLLLLLVHLLCSHWRYCLKIVQKWLCAKLWISISQATRLCTTRVAWYLMCFLFGKMKGLWDFSHACGLSVLIEKIGELVGIREQSRFVNPAPRCCAETACIYICRGSRCFESSIQQTAQLIIPKSSCRATDDPSPTCCHGDSAGVKQVAWKNCLLFCDSLSILLLIFQQS